MGKFHCLSECPQLLHLPWSRETYINSSTDNLSTPEMFSGICTFYEPAKSSASEDSFFSLFLTLVCLLPPTDFKPKAQNFIEDQDNPTSFRWAKCVTPFELHVTTHILSVPYPAVPY